MKTAGACLIVAISLLLAPGISLAQPVATEESLRALIESALRSFLDPASTIDVLVSGVEERDGDLVLGDVTVQAAPAVIRGVAAEFFLHMSDVHLDPAIAAGSGGPVQVRRVGRVLLSASTTAQALRPILAERIPFAEITELSFQGGQFVAAGRIRKGQLRGQSASLRGRLVVERGQTVRLLVLEAKIGGADVPVQLVEGELAKINPILDLSNAPFPLRVKVLALHNDRLEVLAGSD